MKAIFRRALLLGAVFLLLLSFPLCLASCGKGRRQLKKPAEYKIVHSVDVSIEVNRALIALRDAITDATGVTLTVEDDFVPYGEEVPTDTKEILVGPTNRPESTSANFGVDDNGIYFENGRLVISGGSDEGVIAAINRYIDTYIEGEKLYYPKEGDLVRGDYPYKSATIGGVSIHRFSIVYDAKSEVFAGILADEILAATGAKLPVLSSRNDIGEHEILVGRFEKDNARNNVKDLAADGWRVALSDGRLSLVGGDEDGTYAALMALLLRIGSGGESLELSAADSGKTNDMSLYRLNLPDELAPLTLEKAENAGGVLERFLATKSELPNEVTVVEPVKLTRYPLSVRRGEIYVSPSGNDEGAGTIDDPVKTIAEAVDRMKIGGGVIWLRGGVHEVSETIVLDAKKSGTVASPLFIKAYADETPTVTTYKTIDVSWFSPIDMNDPVLNRFDDDVNTMAIMTVSLAEHGFTKDDITELVSTSAAYYDEAKGRYTKSRYGTTPALLIGGEEYNLARYPNEGEELLSFAYAYESGRVTASDASVIYMTWLDRVAAGGTYEGKPIDKYTAIPWEIALGEQPTKNIFTKSYEESPNWERYAPILDWVDTGNIWFCGRTYADWQIDHFNVHVGRQENGDYVCYNGDRSQPSIKSTMPCNLGARTTETATHGHYYYLYNAIEALDIPGEWFIDVENPDLPLYIYPTEDFFGEKEISYTGGFDGNIFELSGISNLVFDGISFEGVGKSAIFTNSTMGNLSSVVIENCSFRNTGSWGVSITGVKLDHVAVIYSDFSRGHAGMLQLSNAAAPSLVPDHNVIQNCTFTDTVPNKHMGINAGGCRTVISHNYLHNTVIDVKEPCYESIFEYNHLIGGSEDVGDGGQIYMYGLYTRGNHLRYNVCHGLSYSGNNLYNDGMCSGNYYYYNVCSTLNGWRTSGQKCFYVSTGHNNVAYNNVFISRDHERKEENLALRGIDIGTGGLENVPIPGGKEYRQVGDSIMYESTLFYCDERDPGYSSNPNGTGSDEAWYSWDMLYRTAAERFTGAVNYKYFDAEMWEARFPSFMDSMQGAMDMFLLQDELGDGYDRRTEVVKLDTLYAETVRALMAEGKTREEAEGEAFRLGYGYTEDFFRQPAYNLYENNILLGGDAAYYFDLDADGIYGEDRGDFVASDYLDGRGGMDDDGNKYSNNSNPFAKDLRIIGKNYYHPNAEEVLANPDPCPGSIVDPEVLLGADYSINAGYLLDVMVALPDFVEFQSLAFDIWK